MNERQDAIVGGVGHPRFDPDWLFILQYLGYTPDQLNVQSTTIKKRQYWKVEYCDSGV